MSVPPGTKPRDMFIRTVHALAKRDPQGWAEFMAAFDAYTNDEMARATETSIDALPLSMGMSRRMVELRKDFTNIEALMASINKKAAGVG